MLEQILTDARIVLPCALLISFIAYTIHSLIEYQAHKRKKRNSYLNMKRCEYCGGELHNAKVDELTGRPFTISSNLKDIPKHEHKHIVKCCFKCDVYIKE